MNDYKNYSEEIFNMLGIKPFQKFHIVSKKDYYSYYGIYYFDSNLICYHINNNNTYINSTVLQEVLSGSLKMVTKLFIKDINLTPEEQTVIDYCKLCGYKYLAKYKDYGIWAYKEKPEKGKELWVELDCDSAMEIKYDLSFLSCDDEEPWIIE